MISRWSAVLPSLGILARGLILAGLLLFVMLVMLPAAWLTKGTDGLCASAVAMGVCLLAGELTLVVERMFAHPQFVLHKVAIGMFVRLGLPLALVTVVYARGGMLADGGMVFYLFGYYFVMLFAVTCLTAGQAEEPLELDSTGFQG